MENNLYTGLELYPDNLPQCHSYSDLFLSKDKASGGGEIIIPDDFKFVDMPAYNQLNLPVCVPFAVRRAIELGELQKNGIQLELSHAWINHARQYKTPEGEEFTAWMRNANGYTIRDAMTSAMIAGIPDKSVYPINSNYLEWKKIVDRPTTKDIVRLTPDKFEEAKKLKIKRFWHCYTQKEIQESIIRTMNPVVVSAYIFPNFLQYRASDVNVREIHYYTGTSVKPIGLHCFDIVGWRKARNAWIMDNSHGPKWGWQGRGFMNYSYVFKEAFGFELEK